MNTTRIVAGESPDFIDPNAYCIAMFEIQGDKRLCEFKEHYKGNPEDNQAHISARIAELLESEGMDDLRDGVYAIEAYPSYFKNDSFDDDRDTVLERVRFTVKKKIEVTRYE